MYFHTIAQREMAVYLLLLRISAMFRATFANSAKFATELQACNLPASSSDMRFQRNACTVSDRQLVRTRSTRQFRPVSTFTSPLWPAPPEDWRTGSRRFRPQYRQEQNTPPTGRQPDHARAVRCGRMRSVAPSVDAFQSDPRGLPHRRPEVSRWRPTECTHRSARWPGHTSDPVFLCFAPLCAITARP